jgi:hypothetical protein
VFREAIHVAGEREGDVHADAPRTQRLRIYVPTKRVSGIISIDANWSHFLRLFCPLLTGAVVVDSETYNSQ